MDKIKLNILGQGRAEPLKIHLLGVFTARLNKKLVSFLVTEAYNFILKAWTVPRPLALDFSAVHRRTVQIVKNNLLCSLVGVGDMANHLVLRIFLCVKRKRNCSLVTVLNLKLCKIYASSVNTARCTRLEPAKRNV